MRFTLLAVSFLAVGGLCACNTDSPDGRSGLAESFGSTITGPRTTRTAPRPGAT